MQFQHYQTSHKGGELADVAILITFLAKLAALINFLVKNLMGLFVQPLHSLYMDLIMKQYSLHHTKNIKNMSRSTTKPTE